MNRRRILVVAAAVLLIGTLPDCGQGAQAKQEEVLKIVAGMEPLTLDITQFSSFNDRIVNENWGEFLLNREPGGKVTPGLASWKVSPDGKRMDLTLRKGVTFHSGDLFTAKDVLFSYERGNAKNAGVKSLLRRVDRVEVVDDYHVAFHFKEPDVLFIPNLAHFPVVSKNYHERVGEDTFVRQPSGSGPYKVVAYRHGEYVDIERFEEYWGKKPPVKRARIYFVPEETTRIAKFKAGEVDLIAAVPYTELKDLEKSPDFKLVRLPTIHPTRSILFGAQNPKMPWHDKRVRLAMAHAIDYESILQNVLYGVPIRLAGLAPHELGYDPELKPYAYDPKKAKALLAEAGYPNGFDLKFYWQIGGRSTMSQEIVEAIASYFEAVGIRTKLIAEELAPTLARRNNAMKPDVELVLYYTAGVAGGVDPTQPLNFYFNAEGGRPIFTTPEITRLIQQAITMFDDTKRAELIKKAVKAIHDETGIIPIHSSIAIYGMKKNINFTPTRGVNVDYLYVKDMAFK